MTAQVIAPQTHTPIPDLDPLTVEPKVGDRELDSLGTIDRFRALIPTTKLLPGDKFYVEIAGEPGTPEGGKSKSVTLPLGSANPRSLNLEKKVVAFLLGKKMLLTYTVIRDGEADKTSEPPLELNVLPLPQSELKAALIREAENGGNGPGLDLTGSSNDLTLRLGIWPLIAEKQRCWIYLEGKKVGDVDHLLPVLQSEPVDGAWITRGYREVKVPYDYFRELLDGSPLKVIVKVALNQEDDKAQAFDFEERVYTVKNVAVAKPEITTVTDLKGIKLSNPGTTKYTTVKLKGSAAPNQPLDISDGASVVDTATADEHGNWEHRLEGLSESMHEIFIEGPKGLKSDVWQFQVEALLEPTIDTVTDSKGKPVADGAMTIDGNLTLRGKVEDGYEVEIFDGTTPLALLRGYGGIWEFKRAFSNRIHVLKAVGRYGDDRPAESAPWSFTVAVQASKPTIETVTDSNGKPIADGSTTTDTRVKLEGTALAYQDVNVFDGEDLIDSITAGKDGVWRYELTGLSQSEHLIKAQVGAGVDSGVWRFTVVEAVKPVIAKVTDSNDKPVANNGETTDTTLKLEGTAGAGETVEIFLGSDPKGTVTAERGVWKYELTGLSPDTHVIKVVASGQDSNTWTVTVKAVAGQPWIRSARDVDGNDIRYATYTASTSVEVSGVASPRQEVSISDNYGFVGTVTADDQGVWTKQLTGLKEGLYIIKVAGSYHTHDRRFIVVDPRVTIISVARDSSGNVIPWSGTTRDRSVVLAGTGAAGEEIEIHNRVTLLGKPRVKPDGRWEFPVSGLTSDTHVFYAYGSYSGGLVSHSYHFRVS
ncbi:hypothetical protein ACIPIN_24655 [Pseudomonas sp. NPDC087697]|uniref:hypothetical protein n=1 Tax=Pseudomonas sp. NPDC087697 TaxID=3364447 RepID=UPI0038297DC8